ncbi:MAG: asparagine synthase-related protein [Actinomycetota bacterium]|nr:asparagine synthase-related protein [Actinomycetota bacterium]
MGGLAGVVSLEKKKKNKEKINLLLDRISHRGKKREIYDIHGNYIGINSNYELRNRAGENIILMDGRIYNLDKLLSKYGIENSGKNSPDINKVSSLFNSEGEKIFEEFQGSFAMALSDADNNLYLMRDVVGGKPLYYLKDDGTLMFASEVKSLAGISKNIKELPPGSCMSNFKSPERIKKIRAEDYSVIDNPQPGELEDKLKEYLLKSFDKRISGRDLAFGVWLSGGLDSSIVAALLKEFSEKVYTYSVGFENSPDLLSARDVAKYLGTNHTEYKLNVEELFSSIPEVVYSLESFDAPLVRSSLGNMVVSKISSSSDMVFSGEGGDELFAGYNYFLDFNSSKLIQKEIVKAICELHNTALQRVDRVANAYGVNVKLPMLDEGLIDFVLEIPPGKKVRKDKNTGKYILRKMASSYLPEAITWREKDKFWEGSGIEDTLEKKIEDIMTDEEFEKERELPGNVMLRNKEEVYYYKIFRKCFSGVNFNNIISLTMDFN